MSEFFVVSPWRGRGRGGRFLSPLVIVHVLTLSLLLTVYSSQLVIRSSYLRKKSLIFLVQEASAASCVLLVERPALLAYIAYRKIVQVFFFLVTVGACRLPVANQCICSESMPISHNDLYFRNIDLVKCHFLSCIDERLDYETFVDNFFYQPEVSGIFPFDS